jgi:hypothetical protein
MSGEKKKVVRGRTSPGHSLSQAIEMLERIIKTAGDGPSARAILCKALGHQSESGPALTKVGSLTHFDLLSRNGSSYEVSDIGKRLIYFESEDQRKVAIAEAAKSPGLYTDLINDFAGKAIPPLLPNILVQRYGVAPKNSADVDRLFRESVEYAGLLRNGILHSDPKHEDDQKGNGVDESPPESDSSSETPAPEMSSPAVTSSNNSVQAGHDRYAIPLKQKRTAVIHLSRPVHQDDLERIKNWIDLMADVLTEADDDVENPAAE